MDKEHYSILLLKDAPSSKSDSNDSSSHDPYKTALHASTRDNLEITVEYLAPLTTLYPDNTLLSRAITEGYPKTPHHNHENSPSLVNSNNDDQSNKDCIWAFAVTSQNAVHAFEKALQIQSDPDIRDAWLQIPIYCLTGATLASVKKIGFKNINRTNTSIASESSSTPSLSFDNASQLVDFLVSIEWPKSSADKDDVTIPILWFLTGEVRMKTMAEKLNEYQKPFREVVVYETGERSEFTQEFYHWLKDTSRIQNNNNNSNNNNEKVGDNNGSSENNSVETKGDKRTIWLVGFSPRGVDISMPTLNQFLKDENDQVQSNSRESSLVTSTEIRWAAIGATTGKRIQEHLSEVILKTTSSNNKDDDDDAAHQQHLQDLQKQQWNVTLNSKVTVAKAPKPGDLAEAILL